MILIYSHTLSPRLQYTCHFIFKQQLGIDFKITTSENELNAFAGAKINYSDTSIPGCFYIACCTLLFEKEIKPQNIESFDCNGYKAFFKSERAGFPFDIFAATFYLLSRYEEYLPHEKDMYGRFAHENSLAFKEGFLHLPVINFWINDLAETLKIINPSIQYKLTGKNFLPTYDIDIAWSFKNKGFLRNAGGFIKHPTLARLKVLAGINKDPFDSYDYLHRLHEKYRLTPVYFFLIAEQGSLYDKNISPAMPAMQKLIKDHTDKYETGLHPSWKSNEETNLLRKEKTLLEGIAGKPISVSRQHYIKFSLPETYEQLILAGITEDYSMGYGSINGFRASVASTFNWYNLKAESETALRVHPFCFMDANAYYEQKLTAEQAYRELMNYYNTCIDAKGTCITIFHNNFLGEGEMIEWKEMYEKFLSSI